MVTPLLHFSPRVRNNTFYLKLAQGSRWLSPQGALVIMPGFLHFPSFAQFVCAEGEGGGQLAACRSLGITGLVVPRQA